MLIEALISVGGQGNYLEQDVFRGISELISDLYY